MHFFLPMYYFPLTAHGVVLAVAVAAGVGAVREHVVEVGAPAVAPGRPAGALAQVVRAPRRAEPGAAQPWPARPALFDTYSTRRLTVTLAVLAPERAPGAVGAAAAARAALVHPVGQHDVVEAQTLCISKVSWEVWMG